MTSTTEQHPGSRWTAAHINKDVRGAVVVHRDGAIAIISDVSRDPASPWVQLQKEMTDLSSPSLLFAPEMINWHLQSGGTPLIEAYLGLHKMPSSSLGVLIQHWESGEYAVLAPDQRETGFQMVPCWKMSSPSQLSYLLPTTKLEDWKVCGLNLTVDHLDTTPLSTQPPRRKLSTSIGSSVLAMAPGATTMVLTAGAGSAGVITGAVLAVGGLATSLALLRPSMSKKPSAIERKSEQIERGFSAPDAVKPELTKLLADRLDAQIDLAQLPRPLQDQLQLMQRLGTHITLNMAKLSTLDQAEATALIFDHLPEAIRLYQDAITSLPTADHPMAVAQLKAQLDLIEGQLRTVESDIKATVLSAQDKHTRFLNAKLRKSDLD